jgi:exonuclease SbcD
MPTRALVLADTHLGFDLPARPRVPRRRRGHDFLAAYGRALGPALEGTVDLLIHAGDVFHRSRVSRDLAYQAFEPLKRVADGGIPVFVVPGNHERSRIPHRDLITHPGIHVFDVPRTFRVTTSAARVAVAGFPHERRDVRSRFAALLDATQVTAVESDIVLLCAHHCFEGATVGPAGYTFRNGPDVVRGADVPAGIAAVVTGHVHRHQVLTTTLSGRPLAAPVLYPGSVERTAFAEIGEPKGYLLLELSADGAGAGGRLLGWSFERLPTRPMIERKLSVHGLGAAAVERMVAEAVHGAPGDSVLRLRVRGRVGRDAHAVFRASRLRLLTPPAMNLDVILVDEPRGPRGVSRRRSRRAGRAVDIGQGELELGSV